MTDIASLRRSIDGVMSRDRGRLLGRLRTLDRTGAVDDSHDVALAEEFAASRLRVEQRASRVPTLHVDESLPIAARADEIVQLIRKHQVIVLAGETGSGKTTQLPKLCLAAGRGAAGMIGCTQPRRIAARTVARRVASELGTNVGDLVGFQVRFTEQVGEAALIKFMTDGILLAETQSDAWLSNYDTIILDEAHERSLNIDFLIGYLKRLLDKRRDLKLIVTSATIDTARFAAHFNNAPVVEVEGRAYPVELRWCPPPERGESSASEQIIAVVDEITASDPRGDVLVFLPGEREIRDAHLTLARCKYRETEVLALYARLSAAEQDRVFKPGTKRRIVLATNVAETSLTVPRIRYVIDTGSARIKRYIPRSQLERLHIEPISQAAAEQRKGRCGRVGPGVCYRLYSEDDFANRPPHSEPEILRSSLAGVILRMLSLKLGHVSEFPFLDPLSERAIGDGYRRLIEIGAVDAQHQLTSIGSVLARLPIDVALGRMLIEARTRNVLRELLVLTAFLSVQDPRERPSDARAQADAAHAQFVDPKSDFLGVLKLWAGYNEAHADLTQSGLRDWCQARFLSFLRMREWRELHRQLLLVVADLGWTLKPTKIDSGNRDSPRALAARQAAEYEAIHRCVLSGWPTQVGRKDERGHYRGTRERKFAIFPGSALAKSPPQWVLAGQIIDIGKVYAMQCARVEPAWIEAQTMHLIKRAWRDPHWSRKRGAVMAFEQVSLFGLILVEKRAVRFGDQDIRLAHEIFVREALVPGEIDVRADFVQANLRVLVQAHELEAKQRRAGLLKSADELAKFFVGKLPTDVHTAAALDTWYRKAAASDQVALRWSLADVLASTPGISASDFPAHMHIGGDHLRLEYRFIPGDPADGVTLHVPLALVNAVSKARCQWLVPGLLQEKVAEMIRGLPKSLRRNFVPAPDFARAFAEEVSSREKSMRDEMLAVELARYLQRVTAVVIGADDFSPIKLAAHLRMRFCVHDEGGRVLSEGRDLADIQQQWGSAARAAFSQRAEAELTREDIAEFDIDDIPDAIVSPAGLTAFPALVDLGESVALRVFERADEALAAHRLGVERLLRRGLADKLKQARRQLPLARKTSLMWAAFGSVETLRADIVEAALRDCLVRLDSVESDLNVRRRADFEQARATLSAQLFPTAVDRLALAETSIGAHAELVPWLEPPLLGFARANYDDLHEQRDALLAPGFLRETSIAQLASFPRYLAGMRLRAERLRLDPVRDQVRMLQVQPYWREYLRRRASSGDSPSLTELRWLIEELRVSLFAQELGTSGSVSAKRLARAVASLDA
ncbi:MAG: ATP-dependent RNA helicase HrpA [Dokdonella sp.]